MRTKEPMDKRLREKYLVDEETGCWNWTASKRGVSGYGQIMMRINDKSVNCLAHRVSYEFHKGEIPDGLTLDHLCRNRACINPDHLEAVTKTDNVNRGNVVLRNYVKENTACRKGHPITLRQLDEAGGNCPRCEKKRVKRISDRYKKYYELNRDECLRRSRDWHDKNADQVKERKARWYQNRGKELQRANNKAKRDVVKPINQQISV